MKVFGGGIRGYSMRRKYHRLHGEGRKKGKTLRLGLSSGTRRRIFRIKISPALAFLRRRVVSLPRVLAYLRDAYVSLMLRMANSPTIAGAGGFGYCGPAAVPSQFCRPAIREYDDKMILQIYKTLQAQGKLSSLTAGDGGAMIARRQALHLA